MSKSGQELYEFAGFRLDVTERLLQRSGRNLPVPDKVFDTLCVLVRNNGQLVSKDELMREVWTGTIVEENNLDQKISLLRQTLGDTGKGKKKFIETVRGHGYRFVAEVKEAVAPEAGAVVAADFGREPAFNSKSFTPHLRSRTTQIGNVVAVADWRKDDDEALYTDLTDAAADAERQPELAPVVNLPKPKFRYAYAATACFALLLLIALSFIWLRPAANTQATSVKGDIEFVNLTAGEDVNSATISPNGAYFVYVSQENDKAHLWLQQTGQATRREVITPFAGAIFGPVFTPDSQFIYFLTNETPDLTCNLYRVPALGGVPSKILTDLASNLSFSPDGQELIFARLDQKAGESSLVIASAAGKQKRTLLTLTGNEMISHASPAWSPDGMTIAYGHVKTDKGLVTYTIEGIDPQSGQTRVLSKEKWANSFRMAWTHDGQGLVFIGTKINEALSTRRDQVYYLNTENGESRRLTTDGDRHQGSSLGVTDADEILAVPFNRLSQVWSMDAGGEASTAVQITKGFADGRAGIAPLADGRVAYLTRNGDGLSIWMMNADGTGRQQLTTDPPGIEELRAPPDGRFFVFSGYIDGQAHLYRTNAVGSDLAQLTFGESWDIDSTISPDGNWIVYSANIVADPPIRSELRRIPSGGGESVLLAAIDCMTPHFSPDGKYLSCVSRDWKNMSVISAENGSVVKTFKTAENPVLNIGARWTPDGKSLAYISSPKNIGNIRLQPIDGYAPYLLTNFTSGEIYNFAFSIDGSELFVARGYPTRNAVLIKNFR